MTDKPNKMKLRYYLGDIVFYIGVTFTMWSAWLCEYHDTVQELKKTRNNWRKWSDEGAEL